MNEDIVVAIYQCLPVTMDGEKSFYLRIQDITLAEKKDNDLTVKLGKYRGKTIDNLENYQDATLVYQEISYSISKHGMNGLKKLLINTQKELEFQKVRISNGQIILEPVMDNKIINILKNHFDFENKRMMTENFLFNNIKNGGSFTLTDEQINLLLQEEPQDYDSINIIVPDIECNIKQKYDLIRKYVFGQDEPLKQVLSSIWYNRDIMSKYEDADDVADMKKTILLCGSTGTGKTLMIKNIAKALGIPYIIEDASRYTAVGYYGENTDNVLINLASMSPSIEEAQNGIIFFDEFDKICQYKDERHHIGTTDVQENLLKLIEGTIIHTRVRKGAFETDFTFDTRKTTFVLSGAFQSIIDQPELNESHMIQYGMLSELAARISPMICLNNPTEEDFRRYLMDSENNYFNRQINYLKTLNVLSSYDQSYFDYVAKKAVERAEGYRGIKKIIDEELVPSLFDIYSENSKQFVFKK